MAALTFATPAKAAQDWQWKYKKWMPAVWQRLAQCETGLNWRHNSGTYQGGYGFYYGSWDAFKKPWYPAEAYNATPWQQYQVALAIHRRYGFSGWGCTKGPEHAWVLNG